MSGFVYFIGPEALLHREDALVKIGYTRNNPRVRLSALQIGSPLPLVLWAYTPGNEDLERAFHATFAELRSHGEWFYVHYKLFDFLGYLGDEPNIGNLITPEQLEVAVFDNIFSLAVPHPSVPEREWLQSAEPERLAGHFPDLWREACQA